MFNLDDFMDNRGLFEHVTYGNSTLQVVSLGEDLINSLKVLPSHEMMVDFVAEHGLAYRGVRISEGPKAEALTVIWNDTDMKESKDEIIKLVCELSDITKLLADKLEAEEMAALEKEEEEKADMVLNGDGEMPLTEDLGKIEADMNAHNNIQ